MGVKEKKSKKGRVVKVYIGYECYYNYCDEFRSVVKVFDCEVKALLGIQT